MAIATQAAVLAWQRASHFPSDPGVQFQLETLKSYLAAQGGNPDLQVVEFDHLTGTDVVIADAACKVYAIVLVKTTATAATFKGTDNATTGSATAGNVTLTQNSIGEAAQTFPSGLPMANGLTLISNTTASGSTTSAAGDGAKGLVILGAP